MLVVVALRVAHDEIAVEALVAQLVGGHDVLTTRHGCIFISRVAVGVHCDRRGHCRWFIADADAAVVVRVLLGNILNRHAAIERIKLSCRVCVDVELKCAHFLDFKNKLLLF